MMSMTENRGQRSPFGADLHPVIKAEVNSWNGSNRIRLRSAVPVAVLLLFLLGFSSRSVAQPQTITGERKAVTYRAVINMQGMSIFERAHGVTNRTIRHKAVRPPLPGGDWDQEYRQNKWQDAGGQPPPEGGQSAPQAASAPFDPDAPPEASVAAAVGPPPGQSPPPATSFQGLVDNNTIIPPDTHGAVGPNHVLTVLNSQVRVQDRNGAVISTVNLDTFWQALGSPDAFDPKAFYDSFENRFIFTAVSDSFADTSSLLIGVSQTSDPTGNWNLYRIDADPANLAWADYPNLGFNKDWIVATVNMFAINPIDQIIHPYFGANIYVFSKTNLYANGSGEHTLLKDDSTKGFTLIPAVTHDNELSTMYMVQVDNLINFLFPLGVNRLQISTITGPVGSEVLELAAAYTPSVDWWWALDFFFLIGGSGPQLGGGFFGIDLGDSRIQNVVYRNGSLWCTHNIYLPNEFFFTVPFHSAVQWWQLEPDGDILQTGRIEDETGNTSYAYPSIAVNRCNDVLIGYSSFSTNQYASANYSFRFGTDPPNTLRSDVLLKAGEGVYFKTFGGFANRWGDYSATMVDPVNDVDMWTIQEYAATPAGTNPPGFFSTESRWAVWWGRIDVIGANTNQILFSSGAYEVNEATPGFATITVLNAGGMAGSVDYATSDGTAIAGADYEPAAGRLEFAFGQTSTNFTFRIIDNSDVHSNKTVKLTLSNPQGGAVLGCLSNAVLTIIDDDTLALPSIAGEFTFSSYLNFGVPYRVTENETTPNALCGAFVPSLLLPDRSAPGAIITVVRTNGSTGRVLVDFSTEPGGFALPGFHYYPTNGTLVFDDFQTSATFLVRVISDSLFFVSSGANFVRLVLSNPRPALEEEAQRPGLIRPKLGNGAEAGLFVLEINDGFLDSPTDTVPDSWWNIERANYRVDEFPTPGTNGGLRAINIDVTLFPAGGPGNVRLKVASIFGDQLYFRTVYPFTLRSPDPATKIVFNAGSDHAEVFEDQNTTPFTNHQVWPNPFFFDPALTTITNYSDVWSTNVTVAFIPGQCRESVTIWVTNDNTVEFNEDIIIYLDDPSSPDDFGPNFSTTLTILHDDPPAGSLDREWNPDNASHTSPSFNPVPGANGMVSAVAAQPDGKTVLVGEFTGVNGQTRNGVGRMNIDGSLDVSFNPNGGANGFVSSVALYRTNSFNAGKILIAGGFSSYNNVQERNGIARVLGNGALDPGFNPGNGAKTLDGLVGSVRAMALQADERIVLAGDFSLFNDEIRHGFARLESNGALDPTFVVSEGVQLGEGVPGIVWALALTSDGAGGEKVFVAGDFLRINGVPQGRIARLNADGSVDATFDTGLGANGPIYALAAQINGQILIAGDFTEIDTRPRNRIARLNPDGSLDTTFDPGAGPDNAVFTLALQADGKALLGGLFRSYNGTRRIGLARVRPNGDLDTTFMDTAHNQFAGLINDFSFEPPNLLNSIAIQPDGNLIIGGAFNQVGGSPSYNAPLRNSWTVFTRADKRKRANLARVWGGVTPGPGNASFDTEDYYIDEHAGVAHLKLQRTDGRLGTLTASSQTSDRLASAGQDYVSNFVANVWPEAYYMTNFDSQDPTNFAPFAVGFVEPVYLKVPLLDDTLQEGDEVIDLRFLNPGGSVTLGGEYIPLGGALGRTTSTLTIKENDVDRGTFGFALSNFVTNENLPGGEATITVIRTNGTVGTVWVQYATTTNTAPPRATPGSTRDYDSKSGTLFFGPGQTTATFTVRIRDDTEVEFDENIGLVLSNPGGGARLPDGRPTSTLAAILTIVDNDFLSGRLNFSSTVYTNSESDGVATITVTRSGGSQNAVSVRYETLNGPPPNGAVAGSDYVSTSGILNWNAGDNTPRTISVPLITDGIVDNDSTRFETVLVRLFDGRVLGVVQTNLLGLRTNATLFIEDADAYGAVAFNQPFYQTDENGGSVAITVSRIGGVAGMGTVDYAISPLSATPGVDYVPTNGQLTFLPGQHSATFHVTLLDDTVGHGNKTFKIALSNPTNMGLGVPNEVTITIVDNESFNEPAGSLDTGFSSTASANGPVYTIVQHPNGKLTIAGEFTEFANVTRRRLARLLTNGLLDTSFDPGIGANDTIRTMALQHDGKLLVGGFFTNYLSTNRNGIARLHIDGTLDASFNPGAGADNPVYSLVIQPNEKILVGGSFNRFSGQTRPRIVRLNTNGVVDASFNTGAGPNSTVFAVALQNDGKVLVGGDFTSVDGFPRSYLARLNANGSVDSTFDIGLGYINGAVRTILIQPDGKIIVGGSFTTVAGMPRSYLARLDSDGTLDTNFMDGASGADNAVYALGLQVDGKVIVAGDFGRFNDVTRNRLTRLNSDGTSDATINFGSGANAFVTTLVIQPDRKIVFGGGFTVYDGEPRLRIARIHGGTMSGPGTFEFTRGLFTVGENATNVLIAVRRRGGTANGTNGQPVSVSYFTSDGTARAGIDYVPASGVLTFPEGETQGSFIVEVTDNVATNADLTVNLSLTGYTGGTTSGPQPNAVLLIVNDEVGVGFSSAHFSINETPVSGSATLTVNRRFGTNSMLSVNFATIAGGTATPFVDYVPTNGVLTFLPGETARNFNVRILADTNIEVSETVFLMLSNAVSAGGSATFLEISSATLNIVDDDFGPGRLQFSSLNYAASEANTNVVITVVRTNGSTGVVSARYRTADGTALAGFDYRATNNILAFADGETVKSVLVSLLDDLLVEGTETINLLLSDPTGGATLGSPSNAVLTILDIDTNLIIASGSSLISESNPNGLIDPDETVTMAFALRNIGSANTTDLMATLLSGNGVTMPVPSGPVSYGVLVAGGGSVSRQFTFRASGVLGNRIVATLRLTDQGTTNFVDFSFTLGGQATVNLANTNRITINDNTIASPYPSTINVANVGGQITKLTATLSNVNHTWPSDIDVLLVGPGGQKVTLMSDAGTNADISSVTLTLDDSAAATLPFLAPIVSGTYRPANYLGTQGSADSFPPPAPGVPYTNVQLSVFNGTNPNGTWSLFVVDDLLGDAGVISNGWRLSINTSDPITPAADLSLGAAAWPNPVLLGGDVTCTLSITNNGPAMATNVVLTDPMPASIQFLAASVSKGTYANASGNFIWNVGTLTNGGKATATVVVKTTAAGTFSNTVNVAGSQTDFNSGDNSVVMVTTVVSQPSLSVLRQGNELLLSWPSAASGFVIEATDTLSPPNWSAVTNSQTQNGGQVTITINPNGSSKFYRLRRE